MNTQALLNNVHTINPDNAIIVNAKNFLTSDQMADLELKNAIKKLPVKTLRSKKEIEKFFNECWPEIP